MSLLKSKIAVVTGGSSGIGQAPARRLVDEGAYAGSIRSVSERHPRKPNVRA